MRKQSIITLIIILILICIFGCMNTKKGEMDMVNDYFVSIGIPISEGDILLHLEKAQYINIETANIRTERELLLQFIERDTNNQADLLNYSFEFVEGVALIRFKSEIWKLHEWIE